jgi:hypothetical protein
VLLTALALAQDTGWGDADDDAGFEQEPLPEIEPPPDARAFGGSIGAEVGVWTQPQDRSVVQRSRFLLGGWTEARAPGLVSYAGLELLVDPLVIAAGPDTDQAVYGVSLVDAQVWGRVTGAGGRDWRAGVFPMTWGQGRVLSAVDSHWSRNLREPGQASFDTARRAPLAMMISEQVGPLYLQYGYVAPWPFTQRSAPAGPFGPLPALLADQDPAVQELLADASWRYTRVVGPGTRGGWDIPFFLRLSYQGSALDLGVVAAGVSDPIGVFELPELSEVLGQVNGGETVDVPLAHYRYTLLAQTGAAATGPVVLRWELAAKLGQPVNAGAVVDGLSFGLRTERVNLLQAQAGVSWSGFVDVDADVQVGRALGAPDDVLFRVDAPSGGLRVHRSLLRERVGVELAGTAWGWDGSYGALARGQVTLTPTDHWSAWVGVIGYRPGTENGPLLGLDAHHQVWAGARWTY